MKKVEKGKMITEGKTKRIYAVIGHDDLVIVENKSEITALDDATLTRKFGSKAICATTTTCNVFELLNACAIPTTYVGRYSETEFIMKKSKMIPLEVVARRRAVGSYLKRHPELETTDKTKPKRFHRLEIEFFLKTTGGKFGELFSGLTDSEGKIIDDPLIVDAKAENWHLVHSKKPSWTRETNINIPQNSFAEIPQQATLKQIENMEKITRQTFLVLEKAWANLGLDLIDFKIEFDENGVSDVIDNDSWRLWHNGKQLDKQVFRDLGETALGQIEENYQFVAALSERLRLPRQALVFWRGSKGDPVPDGIPEVPGVIKINIVKSGHKGTAESLLEADLLIADYPQGGVIVSTIGRSNGLGPILASHIPWPVITYPQNIQEFPEDIWSSIRMPSGVPHLTAWPVANAFNAALTILAQTNPAAYMKLQFEKEDFDNFIA